MMPRIYKKKGIKKVGLCENDELKQMDIWENKVSLVLLISGRLEVGIYDVVNIKKAKK
jgi:hypothetical protein